MVYASIRTYTTFCKDLLNPIVVLMDSTAERIAIWYMCKSFCGLNVAGPNPVPRPPWLLLLFLVHLAFYLARATLHLLPSFCLPL